MGHKKRVRVISVLLVLFIACNHQEDVVIAYRHVVTQAEISAMLNRDLQVYHEQKKYHYGK